MWGGGAGVAASVGWPRALSFDVVSEPLLVVSLNGLVWGFSQYEVLKADKLLPGQLKSSRLSIPEGKAEVTLPLKA